HPPSTLLPYTTLFRSPHVEPLVGTEPQDVDPIGGSAPRVRLERERDTFPSRVRRDPEVDLRGEGQLGKGNAVSHHGAPLRDRRRDRKSTRLNSSHLGI